MGLLAKHALSIVHGCGAALICAAVFYLAGLVLIPRRHASGLTRGGSPAFIGAAVYALVCWYGVRFGVPVARLAVGFTGIVLVLAAVRYRSVRSALHAGGVLSRASLPWLAGFVALYVLTYLFTMPPVSDDVLPTAWTGNIDLLTYLLRTKYLLHLGPSNLAGASFLDDVYLQTPAVFYFLGFLSQLFRSEPLNAAMPAQFALLALIGLLMARISAGVFGLSRRASLAVAAVFVSGPFLRYVVGAYYLSTMMSAPVLLYLIWMTLTAGTGRSSPGASAEGWFDVRLAIQFAAAYVLLLFIYPFLLIAGIAAQAAIVVLLVLAQRWSGSVSRSWRQAGQAGVRLVITMAAPLLVMAIALAQRLAWSMKMVGSLSKPGVAGWPLDVISPLALFGVPLARTDHVQCRTCWGVEIMSPAGRGLALAGFLAIAFAGLVWVWRARRRVSPAEGTLIALACGSVAAYVAYFLVLGPSYQQWKLASYSALLLSFAVVAGGARLFQAGRRGGWRVVGLSIAACFVGGNLWVHNVYDLDLIRFPAELRNLTMVDQRPGFRDVAVEMDDRFNSFNTGLALYFLQTKKVHVISERFEPSEQLSYDRIAHDRPLFIQGFGCEGVGHGDTVTVPALGCLLLEPPSMTLGTSYPFNLTFLFVEFDGLGPRQPEGRWNVGSTVKLRLLADLRRVWAYDDLFLTFRLNPYVPPGTPRQRLRISWGADRHTEVSLSDRDRISLPVQRHDWTGDREWTLPISIDLPDAVPPSWMYTPRGPFEGPLAVMFEEVSIARSAAGRIVGDGTLPAE